MKRINPTNDAETFDNSEEALDELVKAISKMYKQEDVSKKMHGLILKKTVKTERISLGR